MAKYTTFHSDFKDFNDSDTPRNRKRSLRWHSEETALIKKYGSNSSRYIDLYVIDPNRLKA